MRAGTAVGRADHGSGLHCPTAGSGATASRQGLPAGAAVYRSLGAWPSGIRRATLMIAMRGLCASHQRRFAVAIFLAVMPVVLLVATVCPIDLGHHGHGHVPSAAAAACFGMLAALGTITVVIAPLPAGWARLELAATVIPPALYVLHPPPKH